jgi:S-layer homology domain
MGRLRQVALVLGSVVLGCGATLGQAKLGPHVVDSNGQRIGYFIGLGSAGDEAVVSIGGASFRILIARDGFVTGDVTTWNAEADCSGKAYVQDQPGRLLESAWFTTDGFFHYRGSTELADINGTRVMHGDGSFGGCSVASGGGASPFMSPILSTQAPTLTPPFVVVDAFPVSPVPGSASFNDVPTGHPFFKFIEALHASGITGGCQAAPPLYCPDNPVTRGQLAVFLAKALGL